jgi:hypothetical protein
MVAFYVLQCEKHRSRWAATVCNDTETVGRGMEAFAMLVSFERIDEGSGAEQPTGVMKVCRVELGMMWRN